MIVDSSVAAAICLGEADAAQFIDILESAEPVRMSAATYLESAAVLDARRPGAFDVFVNGLGLKIVPFDVEQAEIARAAYSRFGKGSGHPASLNFGDCFSYALARATEDCLLFKGNDFRHTDVIPAI